MKHEQRYLSFDLIRGLAAILVCLSHLRAVELVDYGQILNPNSVDKFIYFLTGLGHQSVMIFFVLSGFFVGGSILRNRGQFSWLNYIIARLTRLWVVLIPALLFTLIVGLVLAEYAPFVLNGQYNEVWHSGPKNGEYSISLTTFLSNMFFLQTIVAPVFGVNGPLWSLASEFWYYLLFPMFIHSMGGFPAYSNRPLRIFTFILAVAIFIMMPVAMRLGFLVWGLGVVLYVGLQRDLRLGTPYTFLTGIVFLLMLFYSKLHVGEFIDVALGVSFVALCLGLPSCGLSGKGFSKFTKVASGLSEISYSLYLTHFPLVVLIGVFCYSSARLMPNSLAYAQLFAWSVFLLLVGYVFWIVFERHTNLVKNQMTKIFKAKQ